MNAANEAVEDARHGRVVQTGELHQIFGYSVSAIEGFFTEGAPKVIQGGPGRPAKIDTAQFHVWCLRREREKVRAEFEGIEAKNENLKDRMMRARARTSELDLAKREGELVEIEVAETLFAGIVGNAKTRLLSLPSRMAPICAVMTDSNAIRGELEKAVFDALEELAATDPAELLKETVDS
jgi:phage terminase Nu1 subunit (DNA packaging protein)